MGRNNIIGGRGAGRGGRSTQGCGGKEQDTMHRHLTRDTDKLPTKRGADERSPREGDSKRSFFTQQNGREEDQHNPTQESVATENEHNSNKKDGPTLGAATKAGANLRERIQRDKAASRRRKEQEIQEWEQRNRELNRKQEERKAKVESIYQDVIEVEKLVIT